MEKEMKIVGICGSPRKGGKTEYLLSLALDEASKTSNIHTQLIRLSDYTIQQCDGCDRCIKEKTCPLDEGDGMKTLNKILLESDALIFASPCYFGSVTGAMKNFMDRTRPLKMDDQKLRDKILSAIAVSGMRNGGAEAVLSAIMLFGLTHGMIIIGGVGDPFKHCWLCIGTLQDEQGWRPIKNDAIGVENCRELGRRVAKLTDSICR